MRRGLAAGSGRPCRGWPPPATKTALDGETWEAELAERDLISIPPGVYRGEINIGEDDVLMCVILGAAKPITPTHPPDHPLAKIKR